MVAIKVVPIAYKLKKNKYYKRAIMITNRKTCICRVIDCKTMLDVKFNDTNVESWCPIDETEGCTIFKLTNL